MRVLGLFCLIFLSFGFSLTDYQKQPRSLAHLNTVIARYPQDQLMSELRSFTQCCRPSRLVGSEGNEAAFNYLEAKLKEKKSGRLTTQNFQLPDHLLESPALSAEQKAYLQQNKIPNGKNLVWEKSGSEQADEVLVITTYFDNLTLDAQKNLDTTSISLGADNNGSGVATLLALIDFLDMMPLKKTVRVVFLNFGEWDSLGLYQYLYQQQQNLEGLKKVHLLQVQMLGHSSARTHQFQRENQLRLYTAESKHLAEVELFRVKGARMASSIDLMLGTRPVAGNFSFGANMLLAQDLDFDKNPRHHTTDDFVETINTSFYGHSFRILAGMALAWAFNLEN